MCVHKYETFLFLTLHFVICLALPAQPVLCPLSCICQFNQASWSISCHWQPQWKDVWTDISLFSQESHMDKLSVHGGLLDVPDFNRKFQSLHLLKLKNNDLTALHSHAFYGLKSLVNLDLSYNRITVMDTQAFGGLHLIQRLNLSHNQLKILPIKVFQPVPMVKVVNLASNVLESIPQDVFHVMSNVEVIDLSVNRLSYLTSAHFRKLQHLRHLNLSGNMFRMFHDDFMPVFQSIPSVDLSGNPFDCSCAVLALRNTIDQLSTSNHSIKVNTTYKPVSRYSSSRFKNLDGCLCHTPRSIAREPLIALNVAKLSCAAPTITMISQTQEITATRDLYLTCVVFGYPSPAIVWNTPWGNSYTHRSHYPLLGDVAIQIRTSQSYEYEMFMDPSHITVSENGTLHISKFRGCFAGNFTCVGIGPSGNDSSVAFVGITSHFREVYYESLFICLYAVCGFFVFSCVVSSLRILVNAVKRKLRSKDDKDLDKAVFESTKFLNSSGAASDCNNDCDDHDDNSSCTPISVPSSVRSTPESEKKYITPDDTNPAGWLPGNIFETLDEARAKLSEGVGRKMEKVRSQVQSFKESGTVYVHNFKTNSSVAANRVRAGVVLGVETIKYSAQSIREFCWVGDMSGQTISMVSVSTDVDTEKQTEVIHTVTFV